MAVIPATITHIDDRRLFIEWVGMNPSDEGEFVEVSQYDTIAVQPDSGDVGWWTTNDPAMGIIGIGSIVAGNDGMVPTNFRFLQPRSTSSANNTRVTLFAARRT